MEPSVGRVVHYVSYGTPRGEYKPECRAAIITELTADPAHPDQVALVVFSPTGSFFNRAVPYNEGAETSGSPDCPDTTTHGNPMRYCACGWMEASPVGGTWHWPERV
jgi:hypothetical protein